MLIERSVIAFGLIMLGVVLWALFNQRAVRRVAAQAPTDPLLSGLKVGTPAILYFTTPFCEPCRTLQKPALEQLQKELGAAVQVIQVDASEQPDAADRWGVFSAPTTFILDHSHRPQRVNRGVASAETLKQQLQFS